MASKRFKKGEKIVIIGGESPRLVWKTGKVINLVKNNYCEVKTDSGEIVIIHRDDIYNLKKYEEESGFSVSSNSTNSLHCHQIARHPVL